MAEVELRRELPTEEIEPMVQVVRPQWDVEEATIKEDGITAIYELLVSTNEGRRECFLKATPLIEEPDRGCVIETEARLTEVVRTNTEIPAPRIIGAVDTHDSLRAPYFLMESMPGTVKHPSLNQEIPSEYLQGIARQTGRYLGQLHELPAPNIDTFGKGISHTSEPVLRGGRPSGDPAELSYTDGQSNWHAGLNDWSEAALEELRESDRFADIAEPIQETLEEVYPELPESLSPVIARIDHGLWNVLTDDSCSEITGVIDWGSLFAVPPAYDLAHVEWILAGGPWLGLEDFPDQREPIREALLDGYETVASIPDDFDFQRQCYQLDIVATGLLAVDEAADRDRVFSPARADEAEAGLREIVAKLRAF